MRLFFATLLLSLFPLSGAAQTLPSLATAGATRTPLVEQLLAIDSSGQPLPAEGTPVLPIWSASNGQLLAVVALPRAWANTPIDSTPAYAGPSAWRLAGSSLAGASGLQWRARNGVHVDAALAHYLAAMPATCDASGCDAPRWSQGTLTGLLGMGWDNASGAVDLSYGLSWLQTQGQPAQFASALPGSALTPVFDLPGIAPYTLDDETSVFARGRWRLEQGPAFDVSASYGRGHASALGLTAAGLGAINLGAINPALSGIDLDQLSLSLGLDVGSLRGAIVGHVLSSDDPAFAGKRWTTLDLGVSWRTPWRGELSIGAQNLWSAPVTPRDADSSQARTPYIQYRQDL